MTTRLIQFIYKDRADQHPETGTEVTAIRVGGGPNYELGMTSCFTAELHILGWSSQTGEVERILFLCFSLSRSLSVRQPPADLTCSEVEEVDDVLIFRLSNCYLLHPPNHQYLTTTS